MFTAMTAKQNKLRPGKNWHSSEADLNNSLHFCMISDRWLGLLEALSNCPLRSKRFRRRKVSILEKTKLHLFDEATCGETTFWNDIALWNLQNWHLLAQDYCDTPCMSNKATPSKTVPVKKLKGAFRWAMHFNNIDKQTNKRWTLAFPNNPT